MKAFLSSAYNDLIEHRIIPAGNKAARDTVKTIHEWGHECANVRLHSFTLAPHASAGVRGSFVDGLSHLLTGTQP